MEFAANGSKEVVKAVFHYHLKCAFICVSNVEVRASRLLLIGSIGLPGPRLNEGDAFPPPWRKIQEVTPTMESIFSVAASIVNQLACGSEIQKLCGFAVESIDSMLSIPGPQTFCILFEDISPTSVVVSLHSRDEAFDESIIGCTIWHRSFEAMDYSDEPTCIILRPDTRIMISGLIPSTEYFFSEQLL
ncbi:hypothetical protein HPP92_013169 [Vanilla planifolia]|uniref:VIN3-like fibronectin type-III domain-containing protein n=1 Tax=Vanilla planifolia TaxID=51239 RepID=A0A835QXM6_VANPL|nr:hypothetical protein HPP92_013169 [Vanilla planifolia]